jgi:hypothetical protein
MASEIHVGDIGTIFKITVKDSDTTVVNVSNADGLFILFKRPDNSFLQVVPSLETNGTDGMIRYVTTSGDLNQYGTWQIQARVIFGSDVFSTDIQRFKVYRNLTL